MDGVYTRNPDGTLSPAIPEPFSYGIAAWLWLRITRYRDEYGRKASL